ncbi:MAG: pilus assembly protein [Chloroflexi bacterium]|nr:MAG: pilus assembly protein [Chloroflexota bacterium]
MAADPEHRELRPHHGHADVQGTDVPMFMNSYRGASAVSRLQRFFVESEGQGGQAMLEFALVLPVVLLIITGVFDVAARPPVRGPTTPASCIPTINSQSSMSCNTRPWVSAARSTSQCAGPTVRARLAPAMGATTATTASKSWRQRGSCRCLRITCSAARSRSRSRAARCW